MQNGETLLDGGVHAESLVVVAFIRQRPDYLVYAGGRGGGCLRIKVRRKKPAETGLLLCDICPPSVNASRFEFILIYIATNPIC